MNEISRPASGFAIRHTSSSPDEFLRRADEAYAQQRKFILDLEEAHVARRSALEASFARKVNEIAHDGVEALRKLDSDHAAQRAEEQAKLEAIARVRR